jgi:hypothetical protein
MSDASVFCGLCLCNSLLDGIYLICCLGYSHGLKSSSTMTCFTGYSHGLGSSSTAGCKGDDIGSDFLGWDSWIWLGLLGGWWCWIGLRGDGIILGDLDICLDSDLDDCWGDNGFRGGGMTCGSIAFAWAWENMIAGTSCASWALASSWMIWITTGGMIVWGRMACGVATAGRAGITAISASRISGACWFSGG